MIKKLYILILLSFLNIGLFAQDRTVRGYVYEKGSKKALAGAEITVHDAPIKSISNELGEFVIDIPDGHNHITISKENYYQLSYVLDNGFEQKAIVIYLDPINVIDPVAKKLIVQDSIFLSYRNTISLSIIELFAVAIGIRYERFISPTHAIGLHASYYVKGQSELEPINDFVDTPYGATYTGLKITPFYRFYPLRKKTLGLFIDTKIPFGYFDFDYIWYKYSGRAGTAQPSSYNFWTWGGAVSFGIMTRLPKTKQGVLNFSVGYQYFPMPEPEDYTRVNSGISYSYPADTDWWYKIGPGGRFQVVLTIGGIF